MDVSAGIIDADLQRIFLLPSLKRMFYGFIGYERGKTGPGVLCVSTVCLNILRCAHRGLIKRRRLSLSILVFGVVLSDPSDLLFERCKA